MNKIKTLLTALAVFGLIFSGAFANLSLRADTAYAATLTGGFLRLEDSRPSEATVTYTAEFDNITLSSIKCIQLIFSDAATGGSAPTGMVTSAATYEAGSSDYVPDSQTWTAASPAAGTVRITNATGETPGSATNGTVAISGITNGSTANTAYYAQFSTYDNTDCSTTPRDSGVVAFIYTAGVTATVTVDPSLSFTVAGVSSGGAINGVTTTVTTTATAYTCTSGQLTLSTNCVGEQLLTVSTNATNGYTVRIQNTGLLTSGGNTIDNYGGTNASPTSFGGAGSAEGFGYTTEDATLEAAAVDRFTTGGGDKWAGFVTTGPGDELVYSASAVSSEQTAIGYQTEIAGTTQAGVYTTTVILTATPVY